MIKLVPKKIFILIASDVLAIFLAVWVGIYIKTGIAIGVFEVIKYYIFWGWALIFPVIFYIFDLYYPYKRFRAAITFLEVFFAIGIGMIVFIAVAFADRSFLQSRIMLSISALSLGAMVYLTRMVYDILLKVNMLSRKALVVGTGKLASDIIRVVNQTPNSGLDIVGAINERKKILGQNKKFAYPILGSVSNIISLIDLYHVEVVVLALSSPNAITELEVISNLIQKKVVVTSALHLFERLEGEVPYKYFNSMYALNLMSQVKMKQYLKLKRTLDVVASVILAIIMSPIFLLCVAILFVESPKDVFFNQKRVGKNGNPFTLYKLRSMKTKRNGKLVVTRFGKWMRKYRFDEIPQIVNVFLGDMSLVGPRPEIMYFVSRCRKKIPFYDTVFAIRPGLTGWAQVKFRYTTSVKDYDRKFRYNLYYIKNISLALDILIILKTIKVVILGKGK